MAAPKEPPLAKLIIAVLYAEQQTCEAARDALIKFFGDIDYTSKAFPFDITDYYAEEMGQPLFRIFYGFQNLIDPGTLATIKLTTNAIEAKFSLDGKRRINLDPGYLDTDKFILASAKQNAQKIYLTQGIWADPTLRYEKGKYHPYPWSFPDFRSERYQSTFMRLRDIFKKQRPH